jgi:S-adenosylmethionine synthetase
MVDTFGTGVVPDAAIERAVRDTFELTPRAITEALDLRKPIFGATAAYGHFGRTPETVRNGSGEKTLFSWERTDHVDALRAAAERAAAR